MTDRAQRNREKKFREDGTEIHPVKDLAEWLQAIPATATQSVTSTPPAAATTATATQPATGDTPAAPTGETSSVNASADVAAGSGDRAAELEKELAQARRELERERQRTPVSHTPIPQLQPAPAPAPQQEDPRWTQYDELLFTDPPAARNLLRAIQKDEVDRQLVQERQKIKQEIYGEMSIEQKREQGNYAFHSAMQQIRDLGVPDDRLNNYTITALYSAITRPPTPTAPNKYFDQGGPLRDAVIVQAWKDLFGVPTATATAAPVATAMTTQPAVAPPGSARPAPAAAPSGQKQVHLDANTKRDVEHLAEQFGYDKEKMLARARKRAQG